MHTYADPASTAATHPSAASSDAALGPHAELARRIYVAVTSYRAGVSYTTQEKRMEESGEAIDPSWGVVATKLTRAVSEAVSERLMSLFG